MKRKTIIPLSIISLALILTLSINVKADYTEELLITPELKKAWVLAQMGQYDEAIKEISQCIDENINKDKEIYGTCSFLYAMILEKKGKPMDALEKYRTAFYNIEKKELKEKALLIRAEIYLNNKLYPESLSAYKLFMESFPQSEYMPHAKAKLADSLKAIGMLKEALDNYNEGEKTAQSLFGKASVMQKLAMTNDAANVFKEAITLDNNGILYQNDEFLYWYGENIRLTNNLPKAKDILSRVKENPYKDMATLSIGIISKDSGDLPKAEEYLTIAAKSSIISVKKDAILRLSQILYDNSKTAEAKKYIEELLSMYINQEETQKAQYLLTAIYRKEKDYLKAAEILNKLYATEKKTQAKEDKTTTNTAKTIEDTILEAAKDNYKDFDKLWDGFLHETITENAKEDFYLKASDTFNSSSKPYMDVLLWLSKNGSETAKLKAVSLLSKIYANLGDKEQALKYMNAVKKKNGASDDLIRQEAKIYYESADYLKALDEILKTKELTKEDLSILRQGIELTPNPEKTVKIYEDAINKFDAGIEDYDNLARIYYKLGKKEEAVKYYKKILVKDPSNEWAAYRVALNISDQTEAKRLIEKLSKTNTLLGNFAKELLKEPSIDKTMKEIY
ncbi:secreted protein [Candidatus Magnetoovum chiemensis]|nr:secreted protein [Candidatus Magnetoovum chiemensis]